jgi:ribosome maturation factor RimP
MMQDELVKLLSPVVEDLGYELWGCEYLAQGKYALLRIYIDKADGIGLEDCESVSKQVSAILDVEDPIPGDYNLEVSSPGVPRGLFYDWQYERYIGAQVQLKLYKPVDKSRKLVGTIISAKPSAVMVKVGLEEKEIPFSNIVKAHLLL